MKCFWGAGHHRWKLKFLGAWLLPCQYPWLLPWISAWSLMPWVLPCHKTSGSMAFAMQPSMVFITTSTTPHLYKACWGWKSESYINSISVDLLRVDWKKKKRISRLPTAERRGWALVHSSFVAPLDLFYSRDCREKQNRKNRWEPEDLIFGSWQVRHVRNKIFFVQFFGF